VSLLENRGRTARALNLSFDVGRVARFRRIGMIDAEKLLYHIRGPPKEKPRLDVRRLAFGARRLADTLMGRKSVPDHGL
jgi:hypothetical protein